MSTAYVGPTALLHGTIGTIAHKSLFAKAFLLFRFPAEGSGGVGSEAVWCERERRSKDKNLAMDEGRRHSGDDGALGVVRE